MDIFIYLSLLVVLFFGTGESGGSKGGSHDHIKLYVPEFHHHKHHTKYITIHHHHKVPEKETHHHNFKPQLPPIPHHNYGFHHTHNNQKTVLKTTTTHVGSGHGHDHHASDHHQTLGHGHQHQDSVSSYDPPVYSNSYNSHIPVLPVPQYPAIPKVHGVSHTVKQVNLYDSSLGAKSGGVGRGKGYEVTEDSDDEDDSFTAVNDLHNVYPSTYDFVRSAAPQTSSHDPFASIAAQNLQSLNTHDSFIPQTAGADTYGDAGLQHEQLNSISSQKDFQLNTEDIPVSFNTGGGHEGSFDSADHSFAATGTGHGNDVYLSGHNDFSSVNLPLSFSREAGIQETVQTGGQHSVVY